MSAERAMTVEEFERIAPLLDSPSELVDGRLRLMSPTNYLHGLLASHVAFILKLYVQTQPDPGDVVGAETGFRINDPRYPVQAPDAAYISAARAPRDSPDGDDPLEHFMDGAPDLAVEVRSPSETFAAIRGKCQRWLNAGSRETWIVDGHRETVHVMRPTGDVVVLHKTDTLTSPDMLPGFSLTLTELFTRRR